MPINFSQQERQNLLDSLGRGRVNAIIAPVLEQILGYPPTQNQTKLRKLIKECIEHDGDLIGSITAAPKGFFIVTTLAEINPYLNRLERIIRSDNDRRNALIAQWNLANPITPTTSAPLIIT